MQNERGSPWASNSRSDSAALIKHPLIHAYALPLETLSKLRQLALPMLVRSTEFAAADSWDLFVTLQRNQSEFRLQRDLDASVQIERELLAVLDQVGCLEGIQGIEFPANLRVVHARPQRWIVERDYATDHMHCDPWAGEPSDILNVFLYLDVSPTSSILELLDVTAAHADAFAARQGKYAEFVDEVRGLSPLQYEPSSGLLILFDGFVPHRTIRGTGAARISLDLRLRRRDPYESLDQDRWSQRLVPWSRYWRLPPPSLDRFAQRLEAELSSLSNLPAMRDLRVANAHCLAAR